MKSAVFILFTVITGYGWGQTEAPEFNNLAACEYAKKVITSEMKYGNNVRVNAECFPKGVKLIQEIP